LGGWRGSEGFGAEIRRRLDLTGRCRPPEPADSGFGLRASIGLRPSGFGSSGNRVDSRLDLLDHVIHRLLLLVSEIGQVCELVQLNAGGIECAIAEGEPDLVEAGGNLRRGIRKLQLQLRKIHPARNASRRGLFVGLAATRQGEHADR
jgi:hypothetical protein